LVRKTLRYELVEPNHDVIGAFVRVTGDERRYLLLAFSAARDKLERTAALAAIHLPQSIQVIGSRY
jgi:hypothetical protein